MDYVALMEPPSSSAGALKSTGSTHPWLRGQVTLFMSPNGDTSQRPSPLCAAHHQTMHQHIKSIHPHYIPVFEMKGTGDGERALCTHIGDIHCWFYQWRQAMPRKQESLYYAVFCTLSVSSHRVNLTSFEGKYAILKL